jgi:pimeloyl-ACP methyl ester carboxylesterase
VLLHGQPGKGAEFRRVIDALGPSVDVVAPDRPGYGDNLSPAGGIDRNLEWLIALVEADAEGRVPLIVAHSWAGGVALALARRRPDLVRGIVLLGSVGPDAVTRLDRVLARPAEFLAARLVSRGRAGAAPGMRARLRAATVAFLVEQAALVGELPPLLDDLDRITAETTIVSGSRDRVVRPATAEALAAALPTAALVTVPNGGHRLHRTHPDLVAGVIHRALAGSGRP